MIDSQSCRFEHVNEPGTDPPTHQLSRSANIAGRRERVITMSLWGYPQASEPPKAPVL